MTLALINVIKTRDVMSVLNVERKHWTSIRNMHTSIADKFQ